MEDDIQLPADVLLSVVSLATGGPRDASRVATVSPAFRAAADSDAVWSRFLPSDLAPLAYPEAPPPQSKKELFTRLSTTHTLLADGLTVIYSYICSSYCSLNAFLEEIETPCCAADPVLQSAWLDRESGGKCHMVAARAMWICWGHVPEYWRWIPHAGSRYSLLINSTIHLF
jgi:hypothetical protein